MKTGFSAVVPILIYLSSQTKLLIPLLCLEAVLIGAYYAHKSYYGVQITHIQLTDDRKNAILRLGTGGPEDEFSVDISKNKTNADKGPNSELFSLIRYKGQPKTVVLMAQQDYANMGADVSNYELARSIMVGDQQEVDNYQFK